MVEILVMLIFLFFSVVGASCFTYRLWMFLIKPKTKNKDMVIVKLNSENRKEQFMYYFEKYRWCGDDYAQTLVMVCDDKPRELYASFCKAHKNIICCQKDELPAIINKVLEG